MSGVGDVVEVWRIALTADADQLDACAGTLSQAERDRAARFRFDEHRIRWVLGHGAVRRIVGNRLGIAPSAVPWLPGGNGKPAVAGLEVNLSHSGTVALLAVAGRAVGVDVEQVPGADPTTMARHFPPCERDELAALSAQPRRARFTTLWTRKESLVKAAGGRLGEALPVHVDDTAAGAGAVVRTGRTHRVRDLAGLVPLPAGYRGAVTLAGEGQYSVVSRTFRWEHA